MKTAKNTTRPKMTVNEAPVRQEGARFPVDCSVFFQNRGRIVNGYVFLVSGNDRRFAEGAGERPRYSILTRDGSLYKNISESMIITREYRKPKKQ